MTFYLLIAFLVLCLYQDVRSRSIHWVLFPLILGVAVIFNFDQLSFPILAMNSLFLIVLMLGLTLYISVKNRKWTNIAAGYFSWGDILFLVAVLPLFDVQGYILFVTAGTMLSLLVHVISSRFSSQQSVPYAGYMALFGIGYLVFQEQFYQFTYSL